MRRGEEEREGQECEEGKGGGGTGRDDTRNLPEVSLRFLMMPSIFLLGRSLS